MRKLCTLIVLLLPLTGPEPVHASKEGILAMDSFQLSSKGIGQSGPVTVAGEQGNDGISKLTILAFGKKFELDGGQLAKIQRFPVNGIQLSYEAGYKELGGRTLYLLLTKGFTSRTAQQKLMTVTESGTVDIQDAPHGIPISAAPLPPLNQ